jgi:hypothetical protein
MSQALLFLTLVAVICFGALGLLAHPMRSSILYSGGWGFRDIFGVAGCSALAIALTLVSSPRHASDRTVKLTAGLVLLSASLFPLLLALSAILVSPCTEQNTLETLNLKGRGDLAGIDVELCTIPMLQGGVTANAVSVPGVGARIFIPPIGGDLFQLSEPIGRALVAHELAHVVHNDGIRYYLVRVVCTILLVWMFFAIRSRLMRKDGYAALGLSFCCFISYLFAILILTSQIKKFQEMTADAYAGTLTSGSDFTNLLQFSGESDVTCSIRNCLTYPMAYERKAIAQGILGPGEHLAAVWRGAILVTINRKD